MRRLFYYWAISAIALVAAAWVIPGVDISRWYHALWIAPLLGLVNMLVGAIAGMVSLVAMPVNLLTLGCFGFIVSFVLYIAAIYFLGNENGPFYPYLSVASWVAAALLAGVMALFSTLLNMLLPRKSR